jgi:hypothetical protein
MLRAERIYGVSKSLFCGKYKVKLFIEYDRICTDLILLYFACYIRACLYIYVYYRDVFFSSLKTKVHGLACFRARY